MVRIGARQDWTAGLVAVTRAGLGGANGLCGWADRAFCLSAQQLLHLVLDQYGDGEAAVVGELAQRAVIGWVQSDGQAGAAPGAAGQRRPTDGLAQRFHRIVEVAPVDAGTCGVEDFGRV